MKTLRCPRCGTWPVTEISVPTGVDGAGFTTVNRIVRCPRCGNKLQGDPSDGAFLEALAAWKADLDELAGTETDDELDGDESDEQPEVHAADDGLAGDTSDDDERTDA